MQETLSLSAIKSRHYRTVQSDWSVFVFNQTSI